jgi:Holliday junction resolvasome RuvABC endonuclease subunit
MPQKPLKILGLNPGTRYLGIAVFQGPELRDWGVKTFKGQWSKEKLKKIKENILELISRYDLNTLAIKELHPARSSANLKALICELKDLARGKGLKVYSYPLQKMKGRFKEESKINKKTLAEILAREYPALLRELAKERENRKPYFWRLFEAVALGAACHSQNENKF